MARAIQRILVNSGLTAEPGASVVIDDARSALLDYLNAINGKRTWFEAQYSRMSAGGKVATVDGWLRGLDGDWQELAAPVSTQEPTLLDTTDGMKGWASGTLVGISNTVIPAAPFTLAIVLQSPTNFNGAIINADTGSGSGQMAVNIADGTASENRLACYSAYNATRLRTGPNGASLFNSPGLLVVEHTGAAITFRQNGNVIAGTSGTVAATLEGLLRLGTFHDGVTSYANPFDGYIEQVITAPEIGATLRNLIRAVVLTDHPGWTIAAG